MKILIVSQNFYPDEFKINDIATSFVKSGHEVTVLTGLGDYSTGKVPKRYRLFKNRNEQLNGVKIHRVRAIARRTGPIFRSLNYMSFAINGWFWGKWQRQKFDIVYVYMISPVTMGIPAMAVAKKQHIPLAIYNLDLWPESVKAMRINENNIAFPLIHKMSRSIYKAADTIAVSSVPFIDYLEKVNQIASERVRFIPQYADEQTDIQDDKAIIKNKAKNNFVFTGNIGLVQDIETIIDAVAALKKRGVQSTAIRIHLVGDGSQLQAIKDMVLKMALTDYIIFYGRQPSSHMAYFYKEADACLLTLKNENMIGATIPAKLQGYMAAHKPVIAAIDGDAKRVIMESKCGFQTTASDAQGLADILLNFMKLTGPERDELGENGYNYFEKHFTKQRFMMDTEQWLLNAIDERGDK